MPVIHFINALLTHHRIVSLLYDTTLKINDHQGDT